MSQPIPHWSGRRAARALAQVKSQSAAKGLPCCICTMRIDYRLPSNEPEGCSVQHIKPRSLFPHLTWDPNNWAPAHLRCNKSKGVSTEETVGLTSRQW